MTTRRRARRVTPPPMPVPRDYRDYLPLVRAVALGVENDVTRGALADWLEERGFAAEAGAVRALAGYAWEGLGLRAVSLSWANDAVPPSLGWVLSDEAGCWWRAWVHGSGPSVPVSVKGECATPDDGKTAVVAALVENRRWCEGGA